MLSTRLALLIASLDMKNKHFAERIGFSNAYITMILNGNKSSPSQRFFDAISREFQVNPEWLRDGIGDMFMLSDSNMTTNDAKLLAKYKLLLPPEKLIIDEIVDAMLIRNICKQKEKSCL